MDLKTFVADSIVQICEGIKDAQERTKDLGAFVSPRMYNSETIAEQDSPALYAEKILFDVAVEVQSLLDKSGNASGKSTLNVVSFRIDVGKESMKTQKDTKSHISRLQFAVNVRWPVVMPKDNGFISRIPEKNEEPYNPY